MGHFRIGKTCNISNGCWDVRERDFKATKKGQVEEV